MRRFHTTQHGALKILLWLSAAPLFCTAAILSPAQTFSTILTFTGANGIQPNGTLVQYTDGTLYGTTFQGGDTTKCSPPSGCGTVFKVTTTGTLTTLHNFEITDGGGPAAGLVLASDGNFYGTTSYGGGTNGTGFGTVFKMSPAGTLTTIYNFCAQATCNGNVNPSSLIQATDGNFYGTTQTGGNQSCAPFGCGTVFEITSSGTLTTIYSFCALSNCTDGFDPQGSLIQGKDGSLYGTTSQGGGGTACAAIPSTGCGTVFKVTTAGALTTLHTFSLTDGAVPVSSLTQGTDGNLYGTTEYGGKTTACGAPIGCGAVFKTTTAGTLTVLHGFATGEGNNPFAGLLQGVDGNFYGTTGNGGTNASCTAATGCGTVFQITTAGTLTTLHSFAGGTDGAGPYSPVVQAKNGNFYGTASYNGNAACNAPIGCGTVFSLTGSPLLTVTLAGTGTGTVTSSPAGISCPTACSANFSSGAVVTLTAAAGSGSSFAGWTGACTGSGTCSVTMSAVKGVTATFNVSGGPAVTLTPASLNFGAVAVNITSAVKTVTLKNSGTAALTISKIAITGTNNTEFVETATTCGASLAAAATCTISVDFKPAATGARSAAISITDNATGSPQQVPLSGTGTTARFVPASYAFGDMAVGVTSSAKIITLTNTGTTAMTIGTITITGTSAADFAQTHTCGTSLAAAASCTFSVTFKPSATGTRTASLSVTDGAAGSPQLVPLNGFGTTLKFAPPSLGFGPVALGVTSAARTVTLTNMGTAALTITTIAITGSNATDFAQTHTCGASLAVGASCTFSVTFKPSATGTRSAFLSVTDNSVGSPQLVPLNGVGTTAKLAPASLSFGSVTVGTTSAAKTITLTNVGTTALTITGIALTGANPGDFQQTHTCGASLTAAASCTISVKFKPSAPGARSAAISVTDNASGSPQQVTLTGTGA